MISSGRSRSTGTPSGCRNSRHSRETARLASRFWAVGGAPLELATQAQVAMIDEIEVGRPVSPHIRLAFEVSDAAGVTSRLYAAGAAVLAEPTVTPWRSLNARLDGP